MVDAQKIKRDAELENTIIKPISSTLDWQVIVARRVQYINPDSDFSKSSLNHLRFHNNFRLIYGDVRLTSILKKYVKGHDFIIPLAALVGASLCKKYPKETVETNVNAIKKILAK